MSASETGLHREAGRQLRAWRSRRGLSQLAVAIECGTSTRHLSFVETGRARAGKDLVLLLFPSDARTRAVMDHHVGTEGAPALRPA